MQQLELLQLQVLQAALTMQQSIWAGVHWKRQQRWQLMVLQQQQLMQVQHAAGAASQQRQLLQAAHTMQQSTWAGMHL
jgi:hypothetical protein